MPPASTKELKVTKSPTLSRWCSFTLLAFHDNPIKQLVPRGGLLRLPVEESPDLGMVHAHDLLQGPLDQHSPGLQHHRLVGDGLDAAQFVRDDDDGHAE